MKNSGRLLPTAIRYLCLFYFILHFDTLVCEVFIFYNRFFYMGNFSRVYMLNDFLARFCFYYFPGWALDDFYIAVMASLLFRSPAFTAFMGHLKSSL